jgi:hypothetical protein
MAHGQAQCLRRLEKLLYRCSGWPCQPISISLKLMDDFRARQNSFVGIRTSGMVKTRICAFLSLLWLRRLNDKTSHRLNSKDNGNCWKSQIFDRRERKMSNLDGWPPWNLLCIASPSPLQDLLRIYHIRKTQDGAILWLQTVYHL